jgi:hypothetical protein
LATKLVHDPVRRLDRAEVADQQVGLGALQAVHLRRDPLLGALLWPVEDGPVHIADAVVMMVGAVHVTETKVDWVPLRVPVVGDRLLVTTVEDRRCHGQILPFVLI